MLSLLCVEHMVPEALQELPICFDFRAERQNAIWSPEEESYIALLSTASARAEGSKNKVTVCQVYGVGRDSLRIFPKQLTLECVFYRFNIAWV